MSSVRSKTAWTPLSYTLSTSLKATSAIDPPDAKQVVVVERLEPVERQGHPLGGAPGEHEPPLVLRLAQERDRVGRDAHEAEPAARERRQRPAQLRERAHLAEERLVPRTAPWHRAAPILAPGTFEAQLVPREQHRHPGQCHLQPDADEVALGGAGDRAEARGVVAVEQVPRVQHRLPRDPGPEAAQRGHRSGAVEAPHAHRGPPKTGPPPRARGV